MSGKRLRNGSDEDSDQPENKRVQKLPSFSRVIREAVMVKSMQNFFGALEPLLRKVVQEELERVLVQSTRSIQRSPQLQIEAAESEPSNLKLIFKSQLSLPIFTASKIEDFESFPLQILLVDTTNGGGSFATLPYALKLEIVVLNGDFPCDGCENWTERDFKRSIVKERTGRRPLLAGDVLVTFREGTAFINDLSFTDNSSWIRRQHFRIGARVVPGSYQGPRIGEAITEPFRVKDHRGELYKKHYPPSLNDDVWRLEKIGKDGAFHRRLSAEHINTVQDFLKLLTIDPDQLRRILGVGMSERVWEGTISHARSCNVGEKIYVFRKQRYTIFMNDICEVVRIDIDGLPILPNQLNRYESVNVQSMVLEAYHNRDGLEEYDGMLFDTHRLQNDLMVQGAEASTWYPGHQQGFMPEVQMGFEEPTESTANNLQLDSSLQRFSGVM